MIRILIFSFIIAVFAGHASAAPRIISAPEAANAVNSGDMILIDIRSPGEWAETGVAEGAVALTMHSPDFPRKISAVLKGQHGKSIALICATGGRTGYVISLLSKDGFKGVIDVSEGMVGNERGPGWIARGLPLVSANEAKEAYQKLILSR